MKKINQIALVMIIAALTSCSAYKQVSYLQNSESYNYEKTNQTMYDARIMAKDLLTITVSTSDPASAIPFNLTVPTPSNGGTQSMYSQPTLQQYLVDNDGQIDFPIIGTLTLGGLTKGEAEDMIKEKLKKYLKETPIVNVRMVNYNISVLGEVARPGVFTIDDEKVNIFEALAMAGDLTIYGQRTDVKLIREDATGKREVIMINLNRANVIESPYYHLQQNDILYVTPNKTKAKNADISNSTTIWFSAAGTAVSIMTLVLSIIL
ncbi:MAG: polysaccharide biosynthesis/export family protein [Rikenellaceae bacterium]